MSETLNSGKSAEDTQNSGPWGEEYQESDPTAVARVQEPLNGWDSLTQVNNHELSSEVLPSPEQKKTELTFEKMAELSTEEYLESWKQQNPFFVAHATRQGVRDHNSMIFHSSGMGALHNGFKSILINGKVLQSPAEVNYGILPNFTEEDVEKAIDKMIAANPDYFDDKSPKQIVDTLPVSFGPAAADPWADKCAIHFAQHTVLDDFYGGETGNEVFFIFPTDVIVSQCKFGGHIHPNDLTTAQVQSERKWNDLFVWPEDGNIPIDAGLVFLPKSQMVDRRTGSKYSMREIADETGEIILSPEKDEGRISRFKEWLDSLSDDSPEIVAMKENGDNSLLREKVREIGIPEHCIGKIIDGGNGYTILGYIKNKHLDNLRLPQEQLERMTQEEISDYSVRKYLSSISADFKEAEDVVTAQEYWEQYFAKHPDLRPAHVIYYDGDPSKAVKDFLADHGILEEKSQSYGSSRDYEQTITGPGDSTERDGKMLGFDENYIESGDEDEKLTSEHRRFNELALKILTEKQKQ